MISSPLQRVRARKGPQGPPFFVSTIRDNGIQPLTSVCSHCVPVLNRKGPKKTGKRFRRRACKSWLFLRVMLIGAVASDLMKGFRILWGNPSGFESRRSHSHLHTLPRPAEGRKGGTAFSQVIKRENRGAVFCSPASRRSGTAVDSHSVQRY